MTGAYVERLGDSGPRVIFVHGSLNAGHIAWAEQRSLATHWRLLILDRRGYGQSPPCAAVDPDADAADIVALLEDCAHLVSTSMGGVSAMKAAATRPEAVRSLTLIEPPLLADHAGNAAVDGLIARLKEAYDVSTGQSPADFLECFIAALGVDIVLPDPLPTALVQAAQMTRTEIPWAVRAPLATIAGASFPKLVISGGQIPAFEAICEALARTLRAERQLFPNTQHAVQRIGRPFNDLLVEFLRRADREGQDSGAQART